MNVMRLHGKFGEREGIVHMRTKFTKGVWLVSLDVNSPNDLTKCKLVKQLM